MYILILVLPLMTGIIISICGRYIGKEGVRYIGILGIMIPMWLSMRLLEGSSSIWGYKYKTWMMSTHYEIMLSEWTKWMFVLITMIGTIVVIYSIWYMSTDSHRNRFISYILIFISNMLWLVSSKSILVMFIGWEGVGIWSYLLINYWFTSIESNKSGMKAILYNRVGDLGMIIGILLYMKDGSIWEIYISIIIASMAKSAQVGFHPWLGNAMAGPTPVSSLIHAATMVTAGIILLNRLEVSNVWIGGITIILGGVSSIYQNDIKKIIAYSTCSQLGYMWVMTGSGNKSLNHLITHGYFKCLLFLCAGILIHNMRENQDIRKMGSIIRIYPYTYILVLVGTLSIMAIPFMSGYYSKEAIIENTLYYNYPLNLYNMTIIGSLLTSIYSIRLIRYVFMGRPRGSKEIYKDYKKDATHIYIILTILALGSIMLGYLIKERLIGVGMYENNSITLELLPNSIKWIPLILSIIGISIGGIEGTSIRRIGYLNRRLFIDSLMNIVIKKYLEYSIIGLKNIDRGILESMGGLGLYRKLDISKRSIIGGSILNIFIVITLLLI